MYRHGSSTTPAAAVWTGTPVASRLKAARTSEARVKNETSCWAFGGMCTSHNDSYIRYVAIKPYSLLFLLAKWRQLLYGCSFRFNPFLFIRGLSCLRCVQGLIISKFYLDFLTTSFLYLVVTLQKYWPGNQATKCLCFLVGPPGRCKLSCWVIWSGVAARYADCNGRLALFFKI